MSNPVGSHTVTLAPIRTLTLLLALTLNANLDLVHFRHWFQLQLELPFQLHPNPNLNFDSNSYSSSNNKCSRCRVVNKGGPEVDLRNDRPGKMTGSIKKHLSGRWPENHHLAPENDHLPTRKITIYLREMTIYLPGKWQFSKSISGKMLFDQCNKCF